MGLGIFGFIYKTLLIRANDPNNEKYWLPKSLQGIDRPNKGGKLLPVKGADWDLGMITGTAGASVGQIIAGQWWMKDTREKRDDLELKNLKAITCPSAPWPHFKIPSITINGLDNVKVLGDPKVEMKDYGYHAVITLQFDYYQGQDSLPKLNTFQLEGTYSLTQCVCSAPVTKDSSLLAECDNFLGARDIQGDGTFKASLQDMFVDATVEIRVDGNREDRKLRVDLVNLAIRGKEATNLPHLSIDDLTIARGGGLAKEIWVGAAEEVLASVDAQRAMMEHLNVVLNNQNNRGSVGEVISQLLNRLLDENLSPVPKGALPSDEGQQAPNAVDQYLFDRIRVALSHAQSEFYLPKVICSSDSPLLEPFQIDQLPLGSPSEMGITFQDLMLHDVKIVGFSNIQVPNDKLIFGKGSIDATLAISTLNPPPKVKLKRNGTVMTKQVPKAPLRMEGKLSTKIEGELVTGELKITVNRSEVSTAVQFIGPELSQLQVVFEKLELDVSPSDLHIELNVDSAFKDIINGVLNQKDTKQQALIGINQKIAEKLNEISRAATEKIREVITKKIDG